MALRNRGGLVSAFLALTTLASHHLDGFQESPDRLTFEAAVDLVRVDVVVTAEDGAFAEGLVREDFVVLEDGVPQEIVAFDRIALPPPPGRPAPSGKPLAGYDVSTNENQGRGRSYVLFLDDLHVSSQRTERVRALAREFVDRWLSSDDRAAVLLTSGSERNVRFTNDAGRLLRTIDGFAGRQMRSRALEIRENDENVAGSMPEFAGRDPLASERAARVNALFSRIGSVSRSLGLVPGRKAILYVGEGFELDPTGLSVSAAGSSMLESARAAVGEANLANVSIYALDPRGVVTLGEELIEVGGVPNSDMKRPPADANPANRGASGMTADGRLDLTALLAEQQRKLSSLRSIAEETGGLAIVQQNDLSRGLARVVADNSRYYLLGYHPNRTEREGTAFRKLEVRVTRPGLTVRARKGYVAPPRRGLEEEIFEGNLSEIPPPLQPLLSSPVPSGGLPLRAVAVPVGLGQSHARVPVVVETSIESFRFTEENGESKAALDVAVAAVDAEGRVVDVEHSRYRLALRPEARARFLRDGFRVMAVLELPPGAYELRIGAVEGGGGSRGSIYLDVEVPPADPPNLAVSDLLLGSANESKVPPASRPENLSVVPLVPTTRRAFDSADELLLHAEVLGGRGEVLVETIVRDSSGGTVFESSRRGPGSRVVRERMELHGLSAGRYTLEVTAREAGRDIEVDRRTVFEVTGPSLSGGVELGTPDYAELLSGYVGGELEPARDAIAEWDRDRVERASRELERSGIDSRTAKAAVLLHTEALVFRWTELSERARASHLDAAERLLKQVGDPTFEKDWMLCLAYYTASFHPEASARYLQSAERLFGDDPEVLLSLATADEHFALTLGESKSLGDAEKRLRRALGLAPGDPEIHLRLGRVLQMVGGLEAEALEQFRWVLEHARDRHFRYLAYLFLGESSRDRGDMRGAVASFRAAIDAAPEWQTAYFALGQALRLQGQTGEGREWVRRGVELPVLSPGYLDGYRLYHLGQIRRLPRVMQRLRDEVLR